MQLLILILKKVHLENEIMEKLAETGVKGGTSLEGTGMAKALINMNELPFFGMLRHIITDEEKLTSKVLLFVLKDEQIPAARAKIKEVIGDLTEPNTGIMFSIPINYVEGFGK